MGGGGRKGRSRELSSNVYHYATHIVCNTHRLYERHCHILLLMYGSVQIHPLLCGCRTRRCFPGSLSVCHVSQRNALPSLGHVCFAVISALFKSALSSSPQLDPLCLHLHRYISLSSSPPLCYICSVFFCTALSAISSSTPLYLLCLHLHRYICSVFISTALLYLLSSSAPLYLLCLHLHRSVISPLSSSPPLCLLCLHLHRSVISALSSFPLLYLLCLHLHRSVISALSLCACSVISPLPACHLQF